VSDGRLGLEMREIGGKKERRKERERRVALECQNYSSCFASLRESERRSEE
jgi:hypothetical protein